MYIPLYHACCGRIEEMNKLRRLLPAIIVFAVIALGGLAYLTIDHYGLETLISNVGVAGIAAIIYAESGLLIGFFLPGDSLLFTAGFLVHLGTILKFNIHLLVLVLFIAAVLGDSTGYAFGRRAGRRLFQRKKSVVFSPENLVRAEEFYQKHGAKTIVIARFVPVVRTFAPIVAGISRMNYRTFLAYNLVGLAERQTFTHQVISQVSGIRKVLMHGGRHPVHVHRHGSQHVRINGQTEFHRVDSIEQTFLVFLQIFIIGQRQTF